jgi:hypothetical protein
MAISKKGADPPLSKPKNIPLAFEWPPYQLKIQKFRKTRIFR